MHGADCPTCGTHVELDFKPVSGLVWCPKCQKLFSPVGSGRDTAGSEPLKSEIRRVCEYWQISERAAASFLSKMTALQTEKAALMEALEHAIGEQRMRIYMTLSRAQSRMTKLRSYIRHLNGRIRRGSRAVAQAIRRGELVRKPCEICGEPKTQAHHEVYNKLLEVMWLCKKHHVEADEIRRRPEKEAAMIQLRRQFPWLS